MRRRSAFVTRNPDPAPQPLFCPTCVTPLVYRQTVIGGVKPIERWDQFDCRTCGSFEYRYRTRTLRVSPYGRESTTFAKWRPSSSD
jgi:hypothetical protein